MDEQLKSDVKERGERGIVHEAARDTGSAVVGALIGVAVGGVPGAVAGAAASPLLAGAIKLASDAILRRRRRAEVAFETALRHNGLSAEQVVSELQDDPGKVDDLVRLIGQVADSDPSLHSILAGAMSELIISKQVRQRERLMILTDALKGLRSTHMRILDALFRSGGSRSASDLAADVGIPEIELRSVVRELELRGMIKDLDKHPTEWKLRELGQALMAFTQPA